MRSCQVATEPRHGAFFAYDATVAVGDAGLVQDIRDQRSQRREPAILAAFGFAAFEYHGVVLVDGQQAFAPTGRSKHDHGVAAWRFALAALPDDPLRNHRGLPGERAELAGNHFRDVTAGKALCLQRF